jgi:ribonuclease R
MAKQSKHNRIYQNLLHVSEQFMKGKNFVPSTRRELMNKLHLLEEQKDIFKDVLETLVKKGVCKFSKGRYLPIQPDIEVVSGLISMHPRGFGFVSVDQPSQYDKDIFIPRHLTQNAVHGDRVEVEVNQFSHSEKGPEGKVHTVLERGRTHLAGIIHQITDSNTPIAYVPILGADHRVYVIQSEEQLHIGKRVILEVIEWGDKSSETTARLSHIIGDISDPGKDVLAAVEEYDLRSEFPSPVVKEAEQFGKQVAQKDLKDREDFRDWEIITIDPTTAKDFDDALSLRKDAKGHYHLGVHIADVSHYVKPDSFLDVEAKTRSNSTYFPGECLPMLPPTLSENLCSLRPNVNRLTASALMEFDRQGSLVKYRLVKGVIKSQKRFTYKEAKRVLDGEEASPHKDILHLMVELCLLLKKKRYERGSLEFSIPELRIIVDDSGAPTGTEFIPYDITHQLVEEFMLKANEVVATHLCNQGIDLTYRIHEEPTEESLNEFASLAHAFGFDLNKNPTPKDFQELFDEALQTPYGPYLAVNYIRRMKLALYSPANIGHYGLALTHYCHFTSPIRRYVDLIIHRILFDKPMTYNEIEAVSKQCSEKERISEKAERSVTLLKKLRLLKKMVDEDPRREFEAIVTRVRNFGFFFEITDLMLEGFLHVSELEDDYYEYNEKSSVLKGNHTGISFFAGDRFTVISKDIDLILLEAKWHYLDKAKQKRTSRKKR